ncbi:hypothetical protein R6Z07M_012046 [Ovis aries]
MEFSERKRSRKSQSFKLVNRDYHHEVYKISDFSSDVNGEAKETQHIFLGELPVVNSSAGSNCCTCNCQSTLQAILQELKTMRKLMQIQAEPTFLLASLTNAFWLILLSPSVHALRVLHKCQLIKLRNNYTRSSSSFPPIDYPPVGTQNRQQPPISLICSQRTAVSRKRNKKKKVPPKTMEPLTVKQKPSALEAEKKAAGAPENSSLPVAEHPSPGESHILGFGIVLESPASDPEVQLAEGFDVFMPKSQLDSILSNYTRSGSLLFRKLVCAFFDDKTLANSLPNGKRKRGLNDNRKGLDQNIVGAIKVSVFEQGQESALSWETFEFEIGQNEDAFKAEFQKNVTSSGAWEVSKIISSLSSAFPVFEDGNKENYGLPQPKNKPAGARTFGERSMSWFPTKPTEVPHTDEFLDDSAMGGVHCNKSLVPSPKSPGDFRFAMQLTSMPFQRLPVDSMHPLEDKENMVANQYTHVALDSFKRNKVKPLKERKFNPIEDISRDSVCLTDVPSASLLRLGQPAAAMLTSKAEWDPLTLPLQRIWQKPAPGSRLN